jgi:predicted nucleic acid-binding protein
MALSFVLADEFTNRSRAALDLISRDGAVVPGLWDYEVVNALHAASRRGRLTPAAHANAVHGLSGLPVERDARRVDWLRLTSVARDHDLSAYDAAYLALALDMNLGLATLDDRIRAAATSAGVVLVPDLP